MKIIAIALLLLTCSAADAQGRRARRSHDAWMQGQQAAVVQQVVAIQPAAPTPTPAGTQESKDALGEVNAARAAKGMPALAHDDLLTQAAYACAQARAASHNAGHTGNDFAYLPSGGQATSAGCAGLDPSWGWQSCCWDDPQWRAAGAAWVMGSDGRRYMHIFVR